jgi:hypothetical protein
LDEKGNDGNLSQRHAGNVDDLKDPSVEQCVPYASRI